MTAMLAGMKGAGPSHGRPGWLWIAERSVRMAPKAGLFGALVGSNGAAWLGDSACVWSGWATWVAFGKGVGLAAGPLGATAIDLGDVGRILIRRLLADRSPARKLPCEGQCLVGG